VSPCFGSNSPSLISSSLQIPVDHRPKAPLEVTNRWAPHLPPPVRAHLRELTGDREAAAADYRAAAKLTDSAPEQRHLISRAKIASDLENVASDSENVASDVEIPESAPTPSRKDTITPTTLQE